MNSGLTRGGTFAIYAVADPGAATRIGQVTADPAILIGGAGRDYAPLEAKGWEHRL